MVLPKDNPSKSFWIEAAESPLRNFRSTEELPKQTDVVIIGSGYTGATTAYWIHKHTASHGTTPEMVMLEARDICGGATGRNGGQLRPHAYSRYVAWSRRFGADGALKLIQHEMAHLPAFAALAAEEGVAEEVCLRYGETFDAAMTAPAWAHLRAQHEAFVRDHGRDGPVIRDVRVIEDPGEAEAFTQMRGALGAVVHPVGQIWPYKFVHALLRIVMDTGKLNLQANTPAVEVSEKDKDGFITVKTPRGDIRAKAVVHASNAWASHVLPEYTNLIFQSVSTVGAVKAPQGFIKASGAQHWGGDIWNYHLQLPAPHNHIILGGAKSVLTHYPRTWLKRNDDDLHLPGVPEYMSTWPNEEVVGWPSSSPAGEGEGEKKATELALPADQGGIWTGIVSPTLDGFPFVGPVPGTGRAGHFLAAGFGGHGMPRILLSTAHLAPLVLDALGVAWSAPALVEDYPPIPAPFVVTAERLAAAAEGAGAAAAAQAEYEDDIRDHEEAAKTEHCNGPRSLHWKGRV